MPVLPLRNWLHYADHPRLLYADPRHFIERFLQHVLPCGFKRIRHYGLLAPAHKRTHLAAARAALGAPSPPPALLESVAAFLRRVSHIETARCPHCSRGQFRVVAVIRPKARLPDPRGPP